MNEFNNLLEADLAGRSLTVGQVVEGTVVQISEDGIFIDIGAKSEGQLQLDQIFQEELAKLQVGDTVKVRIIKKADGVFQLSKKSVDYEEAWNKLIADRDEGKEVEITVREKVKNGYMATAYELLEGFVHHTNFHGKPTIGKTYNAQILDLNRKARKLVFTRREILKREEAEALERDYSMLQEGMVIEGEVEKLSPYGAFVKITDHLTGLLHISEFSYEHVRKPSEVLKPGEVVQVKILSIDREKNKISLSRKATIKDPLMTMLPGEEIDGVVESVVDFGIFVKLDMGVTGLVHISELSFRKFSHPSELYKPGDALRVKVLRVQLEDRRVSLSAKACERDPWEDVYSRYMVDQPVSGKVVQLLQSGAIIKLDEFFEAFLPISEISEERIKHPGDELEEGQEIEGIILSIDSSKRRIRVSIRRTKAQPEGRSESRQVQVQDVGSREDVTPTAGKVTLGDILGSKLDLTGVEREKEEGAAAAESAVEESAQPEAGTEEAAAETGQPESETSEVEKPAPIATPEEPAGESSAPEPAAEDDAQETATPDAETEEPAAATDAAGEVGSAEPAEEDEDKPADAGGATGE